MSARRDIVLGAEGGAARRALGRNLIAVIGIDRYQGWPELSNGVSDARGALALFERLGFEPATAPLLDGAATGKAIHELVADDLQMLGSEDSLVLFYAGHGGTRTDRPGGQEIKTGYLIPVDATQRAATWLELDSWLRAVARLPAKHILVILDACHSGIALGPIIKWRDIGTWQETPLSTLEARRSRRIITSALDDQIALDSGPVYGHSLFTGCLIEGLTHGLGDGCHRVTTGSELGLYVQRRVRTYPHSQQTPDFGTFDFDDRGELVIPLVSERPEEPAEPPPETGFDARPEPPAVEPPSIPELSTGDPMLALELPPSELPVGPSIPAAPLSGSNPASSVVLSPLIPAPEPAVSRAARELGGGRSRRGWLLGSGGAVAAFMLGLVAYRVLRDDPSPRPEAARAEEARPAPPRIEPVTGGSQSPGVAAAKCPADMVHVPGGTFQMGSPAGVGGDDEHPQHAVALSGYCVDKTEVTVKAYAACVAAKECTAAPLTVKGSNYSTEDVKLWSRYCNRSDRPDHPMNCVDWDQAAAYCRWSGKWLPTEAEWEYAARGDDGRTYPWGKEPPSEKRLNACGTECAMMLKRDLKLGWKSMYSARDGWETTAPVGSFPGDASPFSVLDMGGNVAEWTADSHGDYEAAPPPNPQGPKAGTYRVIRGGAWSTDDAGDVRAAIRFRNGASLRSSNVGFRCARGD